MPLFKRQKSRIKTSIQVYDAGNTLTHNGILNEFCRILQSFKCQPEVAIRRDYREVDKTIPLLILCDQQFRIGTDVDKATRETVADDLINLKSVAVVVVHQKDKHALTTNRSNNALVDEKYERFGLIVDIAFGSDGKCYKCSMNDEGFQSLDFFVKQYAKEEQGPTGDTGQSNAKRQQHKIRTGVQVYNRDDTLTSSGFLRHFCCKLEGFDCQPYILVRRGYQEVDKTMPLLVLCNQQFTVETDVDKATREIVADDVTNLKSVALVVVHQKDSHALTTNRSNNVLLEEKYEKFGLIVDVAFGSDRTCYSCRMNDEGFQSLYYFIKQYAKEEKVAEEHDEKSIKKPILQTYYQRECERAEKFHKAMGAEIRHSDEVFEIVQLSSVLDRDKSNPMIAILTANSLMHKEFTCSKETPSYPTPTLLLILQDDCKDKNPEVNDMMTTLYLDERRKDKMAEYVQDIFKKLASGFEGEWTVVNKDEIGERHDDQSFFRRILLLLMNMIHSTEKH